MRRPAISGLAGILLLPVLVVGAAAGLLGGDAGAGLGQPVAGVESNADIPPEYLRLFVRDWGFRVGRAAGFGGAGCPVRSRWRWGRCAAIRAARRFLIVSLGCPRRLIA